MKRVIRYRNLYESDKAKFSTCSTKYEILPILVPNEAGAKELKEITKKLGFSIRRKVIDNNGVGYGYNNKLPSNQVTHAIPTGNMIKRKYFDKEESNTEYLGFITFDERGPLKPSVEPNQTVTDEQAREIANDLAYGVQDYGTHLKGHEIIVMAGWEYYHELPLLGYNLESFQKRMGVDNEDERYFSDSVFQCGECNTWNSNDNGYNNNYRIIDCEIFGIECGCCAKVSKENIETFINNTETPMELDTATELESEGKLKHLERFIGGMTDGRGGSFRGVSTRGGTPQAVLEEYKKKFPKANFLFTHDESGQFQIYFSIWKVCGTKGKSL